MSCAHTLRFVSMILCLVCASQARAEKITREGVGPINKKLSLASSDKLRKVFKGCHVEVNTKVVDRKPTEKSIEVTCHGKKTYVLRSAADLETLNSAEVFIPGTHSPEKIGIGDALASVYKLGQVDCDADVNPPLVRCVFLGDTAVAYSAEDTRKTADGLLPPVEDIKKLKITSIVWRANML